MKISNHQDMQILQQELRPWLEKRGISLQAFDNLPVFQKIWLHGAAYAGNLSLSDAQLRTLHQNLGLGERRTGRGGQFGPAAVESIEHERLKEIFRPLPPSESLPDLYKY